ncbi:MAG: hypothetical protein ACPHID_01060 [Thermoplasmatota archaeon]
MIPRHFHQLLLAPIAAMMLCGCTAATTHEATVETTPLDGPVYVSIATIHETLDLDSSEAVYPVLFEDAKYFTIEEDPNDWPDLVTWEWGYLPFVIEPYDHVLFIDYYLSSEVHQVHTQHVAVGPTGGSAFASVGATDLQVRIFRETMAELWAGGNNYGTFFHSMPILGDHSGPAKMTWTRDVKLPLRSEFNFSTIDATGRVFTEIEARFLGPIEPQFASAVNEILADPIQREQLQAGIERPLDDREREGQYSPTCNWRIQAVGHPCHTPWFW